MAASCEDKRRGNEKGRPQKAKKREHARSQSTAVAGTVTSQHHAADPVSKKPKQEKRRKGNNVVESESIEAASTVQESGALKAPPTSNWEKLRAELKAKAKATVTRQLRKRDLAIMMPCSNLNQQQQQKRRKRHHDGAAGEPDVWERGRAEDAAAGVAYGRGEIVPANGREGREGREEEERVRLEEAEDSAKLTHVVAMDCEMVGVGFEGRRSVLARVSIVNARGAVLVDKLVRPEETVTDYRTAITGITAADFENAHSFSSVQEEVAAIFKGRILVGHALHNDLKALLLSHPKRDIRDTQRFKPLKQGRGRTPSLRRLSSEVLGLDIHEGSHSSVEDARAALLIYLLHRKEWEQSLKPATTATQAHTASVDVQTE